VRRITLTNDVEHDLGGDLLGSFTSFGTGLGRAADGRAEQSPAIQRASKASFTMIAARMIIPGARKSDGPGSLRDFEGRPANGLWPIRDGGQTRHSTPGAWTASSA